MLREKQTATTISGETFLNNWLLNIPYGQSSAKLPGIQSFGHLVILVIRFKFLKDSHDKEKRELKSCSSGFLKLLPISVKKAELLSQVIKMQEIIEHIESCPLLSSFPFLFTDYPSAVWCEGVTLSRISNYVLSTIHTIYFGLNTAS